MLLLLTILHPLVDACSVTVLVAGGFTWERTVVYNALAFALQCPLGFWLDPHPRFMRSGFAVSIVMTLLGVMACAVGLNGWLPLMSVCVGNALFHLCAGKFVLDGIDGKGGPAGLFISTGALGLFAGMKLAADCALCCCLCFGVPLAAFGFWVWLKNGFDVSAPVSLSVRGFAGWLLLGGLFALVVWRSWSGLAAGEMTSSDGFAFACTGAVVTWAGKVAGGHLGDRFGRWATAGVSVAGSVALCFLCSPQQTVAWLVLLFVAQLATGPVLSLMYERSGRAGGSAFGLNCLALFTGSL